MESRRRFSVREENGAEDFGSNLLVNLNSDNVRIRGKPISGNTN